MESQSTTEIPNEEGQKKQTRIVDIPVTNQNEALQLIATFLNLAQKRGAFSLDESAKIWECIKYFQ
jgi:hypothetical protein